MYLGLLLGVFVGELLAVLPATSAAESCAAPTVGQWVGVAGGIKQTSVGKIGLWGVNSAGNVYYRRGTNNHVETEGTAWQHQPGAGLCNVISAGVQSVWAVNRDGKTIHNTAPVIPNTCDIESTKRLNCGPTTEQACLEKRCCWKDDSGSPKCFYKGVSTEILPNANSPWTEVNGSLSQVSVNPANDRLVWGVDADHKIYRRLGITNSNLRGNAWEQVEGPAMDQVSVGPSGVWGIGTDNGRVYYRAGTRNGAMSSGSAWVQVPGTLRYISSGDNVVWGTQSNSFIYYRAGISEENPTGLGWVRVPGGLFFISVSAGNIVYGTNTGQGIFHRRRSASEINIARGKQNAATNAGTWQHVAGALTQTAVGDQVGVWALYKPNQRVYRRAGTENGLDTEGSAWKLQNELLLSQISAGSNTVWGADKDNVVRMKHGSLLKPGTDAKYLGCFKDANARALPNDIWNSAGMTVELCIKHCAMNNRFYAGLQYYSYCFCGMSSAEYDKHGNGTGCTTPCRGDNTQTCGGGWHNSVYQLYDSEGAWTEVDGTMSFVSVSSADDLNVWALSPEGVPHIRKGISANNIKGTAWLEVTGQNMMAISTGSSGVWAVSTDKKVYYREGTYGGERVKGSKWTAVDGDDYIWISSGKDVVWATRANAYIMYRAGMSQKNPLGTHWVRASGGLFTIDVSSVDNFVWGCNRAAAYRRIRGNMEINVGIGEVQNEVEVGGAKNEFAQCTPWGDPHYATFDGNMIHFMGTCKYVMAQSCSDASDVVQFQVLGKQENRGNPRVSYLQYVEIRTQNAVVQLIKGGRVTVNGQYRQLPTTIGSIRVIRSGAYMVLLTSFGLSVSYDGNYNSKVRVPCDYYNGMCGLCGNYDGNRENDFTTRGGELATGATAAAVVGNSWQVDDPTDARCRTEIAPLPICDPSTKTELEQKCSALKDENGPFGQCIRFKPQVAKDALDSCVFDACFGDGEPQERVCVVYEGFADDCQSSSIKTPGWRAAVNCPLSCPANTHYEENMSGCPANCADVDAHHTCSLDDVEGCACDDGYVMSDDTCVTQDTCGCTDEEQQYHGAGTKWKSDDCRVMFECKDGRITTTSLECSINAECVPVNGELTCVCKDGYEGNGATCTAEEVVCEPTAQFNTVSGSVTMVTAGAAGVYGINYYRQLFKRDGDQWVDQNKKMTSVSSGKKYLWGVDEAGKGYVFADGNWILSKKKMMQVHASSFDASVVWGILSTNDPCYLTGISDDKPEGTKWSKVGKKKSIWFSISPDYLWRVATDFSVSYSSLDKPKRFTAIDGRMARVAAGDGVLYGLSPSNEVYYRCGMNATNPVGDKWVKLTGKLSDISVSSEDQETWGVMNSISIKKIVRV